MKDWLGWQRDKEWSFKLRVSDFTSGYALFTFTTPTRRTRTATHLYGASNRLRVHVRVWGRPRGLWQRHADHDFDEPAGAVEVEWAFVYRWSGSSSPDKSDWTIYGRVKDASSWGEWYDQTSEWSNHLDNYDLHDGSTWAGSGMRAYFGFKPSNSHYAGPYIHDLELWNGALELVNGALTPPASSGSSAPTPSIAMSPYDGAWIAAALSGSSPSVEAYRLHALPTADRTVPLLHASVSEFYHDNFGYNHIYSGDGTHLFVASRSYEHPQGQDPKNTWFYERDFVRGTVYAYRWDDARGWVRKGPRIWAADYKVQATRDDNFGAHGRDRRRKHGHHRGPRVCGLGQLPGRMRGRVRMERNGVRAQGPGVSRPPLQEVREQHGGHQQRRQADRLWRVIRKHLLLLRPRFLGAHPRLRVEPAAEKVGEHGRGECAGGR